MPKGHRYKGPMESKNDPLYEDTHGMTLTFSQMADRCLNTEITSIFLDRQEGDIDTLSYLLENGFKGYNNMEPSELIAEYDSMEDKWYEYYEDDQLSFSVSEDDPIHNLEKETV